MKKWHWMFVALLSAWVALAPALAEARAGGGQSQGSRGSRTYESNSARPMERSVTPPAAQQPRPGQPQTAQRPGMGAPGMAQPSFFQRHPFLGGLMGGLVGAGLVGMLFGHGLFGAGLGFASLLGLLLQLALIGGLVYLAVRLIRGRAPVGPTPMAAGPGYARSVEPEPTPMRGGYGGSGVAAVPRNPIEIPIAEGDYNAWSEILAGVQEAWSKGDLNGLRRYVTPEMLSYFSEQLSDQASRGVENRVENVELLKGDVEEAWREGEFEYVTARLTFRAIDYTVRSGTGQVVDGDPNRPTEATEVWTFVRSRGGRWLLSAIQQV